MGAWALGRVASHFLTAVRGAGQAGLRVLWGSRSHPVHTAIERWRQSSNCSLRSGSWKKQGSGMSLKMAFG